MTYEDFDNFIFTKPLVLFLENDQGVPVSKTLTEYSDLMKLFGDIRDGKLKGGLGDLTLERQLWLSLAQFSGLIRDKAFA